MPVGILKSLMARHEPPSQVHEFQILAGASQTATFIGQCTYAPPPRRRIEPQLMPGTKAPEPLAIHPSQYHRALLLLQSAERAAASKGNAPMAVRFARYAALLQAQPPTSGAALPMPSDEDCDQLATILHRANLGLGDRMDKAAVLDWLQQTRFRLGRPGAQGPRERTKRAPTPG